MASLFRPEGARPRRVVAAIPDVAQVDRGHLRIDFRHPSQQGNGDEPQHSADDEGDSVHAGDGEAAGNDRRAQRRLALAAQEQVRAMQDAVEGHAAKASHNRSGDAERGGEVRHADDERADQHQHDDTADELIDLTAEHQRRAARDHCEK